MSVFFPKITLIFSDIDKLWKKTASQKQCLERPPSMIECIYDRMQPDMSYILAIMQQPGKIKQAEQMVNKKAPVQSSLTTRTH